VTATDHIAPAGLAENFLGIKDQLVDWGMHNIFKNLAGVPCFSYCGNRRTPLGNSQILPDMTFSPWALQIWLDDVPRYPSLTAAPWPIMATLI